MATEARPGSGADVGLALTAIAGAGATAIVLLAHRSDPLRAVVLVPVVVVSVHLAVIDTREHRLPNPIVAGLAVLVTGGVLIAGVADGDLGQTGRAIGLGLAATAVFLAAHVVGGVGMGDVKFAYPIAATVGWFGIDPLGVATVVMLLAGGVAAVVVLARGGGRDRRLPFGPCMVAGLIAGLVAAGTPSL